MQNRIEGWNPPPSSEGLPGGVGINPCRQAGGREARLIAGVTHQGILIFSDVGENWKAIRGIVLAIGHSTPFLQLLNCRIVLPEGRMGRVHPRANEQALASHTHSRLSQ